MLEKHKIRHSRVKCEQEQPRSKREQKKRESVTE